MERLVFHEKFPVLGTLIFPGFSPVCRDFENFHKVPLCVGPVVCGHFELFPKIPLCVSPIVCENFEIFSKYPFVWTLYVGTLKIFKVPLCVGCVLETLKISRKIPVLVNFLKALKKNVDSLRIYVEF